MIIEEKDLNKNFSYDVSSCPSNISTFCSSDGYEYNLLNNQYINYGSSDVNENSLLNKYFIKYDCLDVNDKNTNKLNFIENDIYYNNNNIYSIMINNIGFMNNYYNLLLQDINNISENQNYSIY